MPVHTLVRAAAVLLALFASAAVFAQTPSNPPPANAPPPFTVETLNAIDVDRGGVVRARVVVPPPGADIRAGAILIGEAAIRRLADGRRVTVRWTTIADASGNAPAPLAPPAESMVRVETSAALPIATRMRVAWAGARAAKPANGRDISLLPSTPTAAQDAIARRAREAGRIGPAGSGQTITLDMLTGAAPNPLDPPRRGDRGNLP